MSDNDQGRVRIDPNVVQRDRELQIRNQAMTGSTNSMPSLNVRDGSISRFEYNGDGLNVKSGTYIKENTDVDGTPL